ncbi:MAG: RNA polymerase sigma factor [Sandaracinaceae bacterium]|nr:RNA polymerase sigma factor [Sandaracinaceae bacterium]
MIGVASWIALSPVSEHETERRAHARLVERLRARDLALYEEVLRELLPRVRTWLLRLLGPHPDLDDATQESLAEIASALHRFEGRSSLAALARRITLRTGLRHCRRSAPWQLAHLAADLDLAEWATPERTIANRQVITRLYEHLEALSPKRRAAFVLCVVEGLTPAEAADALECSAVAMRSRLFEARAELAARIERDPELRSLVEGSWTE